jgi:ankyrin repeat protein
MFGDADLHPPEPRTRARWEEVDVNLEQLRKQAKELVRAARAGDPEALARLGDLPVKLASAQLVLAREHGFRSWPALAAAAGASPERFVIAATSGRRDRAEALLEHLPEPVRDAWVRLVLGEGWDGDANEVGGPCGWPPLHYACHSCFANAELVRELLERGADPNAYFANAYGPMSAVYGAAGVVHDSEITRLLLDAGADPNGEPRFGDALYHSVEAESSDCTRLLLGRGARPQGSNALAHALDYDHVEHVRLLLEAGDDVDGRHLVHAVRRGCSVETLRLLVEHASDLDRPGGEWSTPRSEYRTAYQNAVLRGRDDYASALAEGGASTEVSPEDRAVAAAARGETPEGGPPAKLGPDQEEALIVAALNGRLDHVVDLLGPDFFGHVGGGPPGTLLHHACWVGDPAIVARLLERGADAVARSGAEFDKPIAWAALGSQEWRIPARDYVRVVELLLGAGAELEPRFADVAEGPLAEWLEGRI